MRVDELERALGQMASSQQPVDDRLAHIRRRAHRRRQRQVFAAACACALVLVVFGSLMWRPEPSRRPLSVSAGQPESPLTAPDSEGTTTSSMVVSDHLACTGTAKMVEILPADGGAPTPEQEIPNFLATAASGAPMGDYVPATTTGRSTPGASGDTVPGMPAPLEQRLYMHRTPGGAVDAQLTLIRLTSGWRVDSATWCS